MEYAGITLHRVLNQLIYQLDDRDILQILTGVYRLLSVTCGGRFRHRDLHYANVTYLLNAAGEPDLNHPILIDFGRGLFDERYDANLPDDSYKGDFDMYSLTASLINEYSELLRHLTHGRRHSKISKCVGYLYSLNRSEIKEFDFFMSPGGTFSWIQSYNMMKNVQEAIADSPEHPGLIRVFTYSDQVKRMWADGFNRLPALTYTEFPTIASLVSAAAAAAAVAAAPLVPHGAPRKQRGGGEKLPIRPYGGTLALGLLHLERAEYEEGSLHQKFCDIAIQMLEEKAEMEATRRMTKNSIITFPLPTRNHTRRKQRHSRNSRNSGNSGNSRSNRKNGHKQSRRRRRHR